MRAYIYVGGKINAAAITHRPDRDDLVIAADSGYDNALAVKVKPSVLVGDMDSIRCRDLPQEIEVLPFNSDKDNTDTQLAVELALTRGAREIVIIGGLSGRLDHTLSNLGVLEFLHGIGVHALITDGWNRVRFIRNGSTLLPRGGFTYLSLIAADPVVKGVDVEGCKYPLKKARLTRTLQYAVSNELTGNCALVAVRKGGLFIVESKEENNGIV